MLVLRSRNDVGRNRFFGPFRELRNMHDEVDRLFSALLPVGDADTAPAQGWAPSVDIYEEQDQFVVKAELPGVKKEDLQLTLTEDTLTIRGERKHEKEEKQENFLRIESSYGLFQRTIQLPKPVKADGVKAEYKDGILSVRLPKADEVKTREIKVDVK